jgi:polar amino acid transport system permease protein
MKEHKVEYAQNISGYILKGFVTTMEIWSVTMLIAVPAALLLAMIKVLRLPVIKVVLDVYTSLIRGTPLMFQLFFVYFGLPILFSIRLDPFVAATITFANSWTAYLTEIFRAGIASVDKGQYEAARALGLNYWQMMRRIIIPQALIAVLPSVNNQAIELVYNTPLLATIGMSDLLKNAKTFVMRDLSLTPFVIAGVIYFAFNALVILAFRMLERRVSAYKLVS